MRKWTIPSALLLLCLLFILPDQGTLGYISLFSAIKDIRREINYLFLGS